eukprot:Skav224574  [mRNA]  locus=scaffold246:87657:89250:- [translate_table: standard]
MPGPWISAKDNPDFMSQRGWRMGELFESTVHDNAGKPQGRAIWMVLGVRKEPLNGIWLTYTLEVVENTDLYWWLTKGPGKEHTRIFKVHICSGRISKYRQNRLPKDDEYHLDYLRMLEVDDLKFRGDKGDDEYPLPLDDDDNVPLPEGEEEPAAMPDIGRLGRDLARLKGDLRGGKRRAAPKQKVVLKAATKAAAAPAAAEAEIEEDPQEEAEKAPQWFGGAIPKKKKAPSTKRGKKKAKKKVPKPFAEESRTSSEERQRRAKRKADRGPYGVGEMLNFGDVDYEGSSEEDEESGFRGAASEKRSQQLRLMEYALLKPGRLTSRLVLKMQQLLARESGAAINDLSRLSTLTPPVATSYLLTVMVPTHRERLGVRLLREIRTLTAALDELARGENARAGDIISQRLKALELQLTDGGWQRAQFLELIPPEGPQLAERSEQAMAAREQAAEAKMRQYLPGVGRSTWYPEGETSKGKGKGKQKGKKGSGQKGQNPPQESPKAPVA